MKIVKTAAAVSMMIDTESFLKLVGWMSFSVDSDIYVAIYGVSDDSSKSTITDTSSNTSTYKSSSTSTYKSSSTSTDTSSITMIFRTNYSLIKL